MTCSSSHSSPLIVIYSSINAMDRYSTQSLLSSSTVQFRVIVQGQSITHLSVTTVLQSMLCSLLSFHFYVFFLAHFIVCPELCALVFHVNLSNAHEAHLIEFVSKPELRGSPLFIEKCVHVYTVYCNTKHCVWFFVFLNLLST